MSDKLDLNELSGQLGIKLKNANTGDLEPDPSQSQAANIVELERDSQPAEANPLFKFLLLGGVLFGTVGLGLITILWGAGDNTQKAKKPDSFPKEEQVVNADRQKEIADLKASLAMNQQKLEAAQLKAAKNPTDPAADAAPTSKSPATVSPVKQQNIAAAITRPMAAQPSPQDTAQVAAIERAKQQGTTELAAIDRAKQQGTAQLATLRQSLQQGAGQVASLRQAGQKQQTELNRLTELVKQQRQQLAALMQQQNAAKVAKTNAPEPNRTPQTQTMAANDRSSTSNRSEMSWEEASTLASYGGAPELQQTLNSQNQSTQPSDSIVNALASSPLLRLPVGLEVGGRLVTPFYTLVGNANSFQQAQKSTVQIAIDKPIDVGSGYNLPTGTAIEFEFQVADNGMIQATSKKVTFGNSEIQIPPGAFVLLGNNNQPLFAQIKEVNSDQLASVDLRSALFGGASEVGNVLINAGNSSSVTIGGGSTIATNNNGNPNILGAVFKGVFSPLAQTQATRSQTLASKLDKQSKVGYLPPGTTMRVYVAQAATFQIPTNNPLTQAANPLQTGTAYVAPRIAQVPSISSSAPISPQLNARLLPSPTIPPQVPATTSLLNPAYTPTPDRSLATPLTYLPQSSQLGTSTPITTLPYPQPVTPTPTQLPISNTRTSLLQSTQPLVKVDTAGQLLIQPPGTNLQISPARLPNLPLNIQSVFPR